MARREKTTQIREQIVKRTDDLLYKKGFNLMSFTDIAEVADVPRGNIYYYFKTKDEVLKAVIEYRIEGMKQMLTEWETNYPTPLQRLKRYAQIPLNEKQRVIEYGCPMGTLNSELGKSQASLQHLAKQQMDIFNNWLTKQFTLLIADQGSNQSAAELAEHLLILTQGMSVVSHIYKDESILLREVQNIEKWLDSCIATV